MKQKWLYLTAERGTYNSKMRANSQNSGTIHKLNVLSGEFAFGTGRIGGNAP
jgi:hypothetical protein